MSTDCSMDEQTNLNNISSLLGSLIRKIVEELKLPGIDKSGERFLLYLTRLTFECGFLPVCEENVIDNPMESAKDQLSIWKLKEGAYELLLVVRGFENIPIKLFVINLGVTVLVNMVIQSTEKIEPYSLCIQLNKYIEDTNADFNEMRDLEISIKNNILNPVKSKVLNICGFPSASLIGIPDELFVEIMSYLNVKDIVNVSKTCKRFKELTSNIGLWQELRPTTNLPQKVSDKGDITGRNALDIFS